MPKKPHDPRITVTPLAPLITMTEDQLYGGCSLDTILNELHAQRADRAVLREKLRPKTRTH